MKAYFTKTLKEKSKGLRQVILLDTNGSQGPVHLPG
jgi:hypothetical protein